MIAAERRRLAREAARSHVTTERDAVKLEHLSLPTLPVYVSEIALRPADRDAVTRLCLDAMLPLPRRRSE